MQEIAISKAVSLPFLSATLTFVKDTVNPLTSPRVAADIPRIQSCV